MQNPFPDPPPSAFPPMPVQIARGRYFVVALPAGWQVQENTNMVCLTAPDGVASIMGIGLVGMLQPFTPEQFLYYSLNMVQIQVIGIFNVEAIPPAPGCSSAGMFEILYLCNGSRAQGVVHCHVAAGYNQCSGSLTLAAARESAWAQYRDWLPQVAAQIAPAGPHTYMAATVSANDRRATAELAQRWHEVNNYTQNLHQQTTDARWASQERQNFQFRENLGTVATYYHPYENRLVELPTQYRYYWVNRQGGLYGSDDPSDDPRVGSTEEWVELGRYQPG
jgi:hypothetical protein